MKEEYRIKLIAVKDNPDIFQNRQTVGWCGDTKPFMKKGWVTWTDSYTLKHFLEEKSKPYTLNRSIILEGNKYQINFCLHAFEIYHDTPYKRKLQENRLKREQYIEQSEITHKIKLISI
jgi:hypothetical protein